MNSHWNGSPNDGMELIASGGGQGGLQPGIVPGTLLSGCVQRKAVRADEPGLTGLQPEQVSAPQGPCDFPPLLNKTHNKLFSLKV